MRKILPQYDYLYLGDNARAPYGPRSFDVVYQFTREAVEKLFSMGCHLVILACNTASAKALRTLQVNDIPRWVPDRRILGVIRPTAECIGDITKSRHVGILATEGTIRSKSYDMEIHKLFPDIVVTGVACPLWAAIVEANEADSEGAEYFVKKRIKQMFSADDKIDSVILGCTHYPMLLNSIKKHIPQGVQIIPQGDYVANSLKTYLNRHQLLEEKITKGGTVRYLTSENPERFKECAQVFLNDGEELSVQQTTLQASLQQEL
jgi:glutamate racemase